jgi:hypothetical protein
MKKRITGILLALLLCARPRSHRNAHGVNRACKWQKHVV